MTGLVTPYRSALVLGLGISGAAAARLLRREGARVRVADQGDSAELRQRAAALAAEGVEARLGCRALPDPADEDIGVVSPGIRSDSEWVRTLEDRGVPVVSELELGASRCRCAILAVTGSNGKSTLVKLCGEALALGGKRVALAGNYGPALCDAAERSGELDWMVTEVSSFQLEKVRGFHPRVGVLLNLQPNHLDRHPDFPAYASLKARLFDRMGEGDVAVVHDEAAGTVRGLTRGRPAWVTFGLSASADYRYRDGEILYRESGERKSIPAGETYFANDILGLAAAAAVAAVRACGVERSAVAEAMRRFQPLPHRLREIARVRNVRFVDDSKATSMASMRAALLMAPGRVRLIAGGLLKGDDLASVKEVLAKKVQTLYVIGKASGPMESAWRDVAACERCETLDRAVRRAWEDAQAGDTVLLSPGCASFDQFRNFEERGERFAEIVNAIAREAHR